MEDPSTSNKKNFSVNAVKSKENLEAEDEPLVENKKNASVSFIRSKSNNDSVSKSLLVIDSSFVRNNSPAYSIGKSERSVELPRTPGPGDYNLPDLPKGQSCTFSTTPKLNCFYSSSLTPGPADYSPVFRSHSPSSFVIGKPKEERRLFTPGPGSYETDIKIHSQSVIIGGQPRFKDIEKTPGPCDYSSTFVKVNNPKCTIGKSKRRLMGSEIGEKSFSPGPGAYSTDIVKNSQSSILIGKPNEKIVKTPGPGDYSTEAKNIRSNSPAYTIGRSPRPDIVRNNYPGPCDYSTMPRSNSQEIKFSRTSTPQLLIPKISMTTVLSMYSPMFALSRPTRLRWRVPLNISASPVAC